MAKKPKNIRQGIASSKSEIGLLFALGLMTVLLAANGFISYRNIFQLHTDSSLVNHTHEVLGILRNLRTGLSAAESSQRGYVITGRKSYLEAYHDMLPEIDRNYRTLTQLVADGRKQTSHMKTLREKISTRLEIMQDVVMKRQSLGFEAARQAVTSNKGKIAMEEAKDEMDRMAKSGYLLLAERKNKSRQTYQIAIFSSIAATLMALGMLTAFLSLFRRHARAQKLAAETLYERQERFRITLASIGDAVITTDQYGRVTYLNPIAEMMTGWFSKDAAGRLLSEVFLIINEETRKSIENPVTKVLREGKIIGLANHTLLISKAKREYPIDDSAAPIRDQSGRIIGVVLIFRDVTEQRRAERLLRENEERFRMAIAAGQVGTWDWNIPENQVTWSERTYEFHGLKPGEFDGRVESFSKLIHPADVDRVQEAIRQSVEKLVPYNIEFRVRHSTGEVRWLSTSARVLTNEMGQPVRMLGATADITKQRAVQETLKEQRRTLEIINEVGKTIAAELDLNRLVQSVTDAARMLCGAEFGAFFYNTKNENGESYTLYTLSGASRESFAGFGMPRATPLFGPTFRGEKVIRSGDILQDLSLWKNGTPSRHA